VAFERGSTESLRGELDGSFDGVVALAVLRRDQDERAGQIMELWRVLKPGGWMLVGGPAAGESIATILVESGVQEVEIADSEVVTRGPDGQMTFRVRKGVPTAAEFRNESDSGEGSRDA
jgi:ubiquinone/menaquinone biosynthesis C-methylase UbiE